MGILKLSKNKGQGEIRKSCSVLILCGKLEINLLAELIQKGVGISLYLYFDLYGGCEHALASLQNTDITRAIFSNS